MNNRRWQKIAEAGRILKLPDDVTRLEIQQAYRRRCRELHPDYASHDNENEINLVNAAYRLLMDYCDNYRITLEPNENGMTEGEWWMLHFGQDPVWHSDD